MAIFRSKTWTFKNSNLFHNFTIWQINVYSLIGCVMSVILYLPFDKPHFDAKNAAGRLFFDSDNVLWRFKLRCTSRNPKKILAFKITWKKPNNIVVILKVNKTRVILIRTNPARKSWIVTSKKTWLMKLWSESWCIDD